MTLRAVMLLFLFFFATSLVCSADTFTVTTNADSGPGSLRQAMQNAIDNGTSTVDYILFNIPDVSRAGRTIKLDSRLPDLSSNLVIDGTSQPGTAFGISDAKVQIEQNGYYPNYSALFGAEISDISIFGLYLKGMGDGTALYCPEISNLRFGAPGKGNLVTGFYVGIYSDNQNYLNGRDENLTFQGNMIGIDENGMTSDNLLANFYTFIIGGIKNLLIGGLGPGEGNLICDRYSTLDLTYLQPDDGGYLKIQGNKVGTDKTGINKITVPNSGEFYIDGYNSGGDDPEGTTSVAIDMTNNIISGRIFPNNIKSYFNIKGNHFGVGADNITSLGNAYAHLLFFTFCGQGMVGGPNPEDKNYFAYANGDGVGEFESGNITISQNSFFCNSQPGIQFMVWPFYNRKQPFVTITAIGTNTVSGKALPKSTIELFYDDACPGCEGKSYIGTTTADASGNWLYNGFYNGGVVATATDTLGATSEFSVATINTDKVTVKDATCGRNNGYVKKVKVVSGTDWYWENESGTVIGHDSDLVNLAPGRYKLVASIGGNSCKAESIWFDIKNINVPVMDSTAIALTQPSCGLNNGALFSNAAFNDSFNYRWVNHEGVVLNNDFEQKNPFDQLFPGDYYLNIRLNYDTTCFTQYGAFKLINQSGPSLNFDAMQVNHTTCKKNNGSITHISYENASGNVYTAWQDSLGNIVSTNLDLENIPAGKYRLKFKDNSGCDTIVTPYYLVADSGYISIDSTAIHIQPSGCKSATGSISGITVGGAEQYQWMKVSDNTVTGNAVDLFNAAPGSYILQLSNHFSCTISIGPFVITQAGFSNIGVNASTINHASCNIANGSVTINTFSKDTIGYAFLWKDDNGNSAGNTTVLVNAGNGNYQLFATDENGCTGKIFDTEIQQFGMPVFDYSAMKVIADTCNQHTGSIQGVIVTGGLAPCQWQWENSLNAAVSDESAVLHLSQEMYVATVQDKNHCTISGNPIQIINVNAIPVSPRVEDQYIPRNTSTTVTVLNPLEGTYDLLDDSPVPVVIASSNNGVFETPVISADQSFYVRRNRGDCAGDLAKFTVKVFDSTIIYVPSAFTPNRDGKNDSWRVIVLGKLNSFSLSVYNRWGQVVYATNRVGDSWGGTLNGNALPSGVFVYSIQATDYRNNPIRQKGYITIIR